MQSVKQDRGLSGNNHTEMLVRRSSTCIPPRPLFPRCFRRDRMGSFVTAVYLPWISLHSHNLFELTINIWRSYVKKTDATFRSMVRECCVHYIATRVMKKRDKKLGADFQEAATGSSDERSIRVLNKVPVKIKPSAKL